MKPITFPESNVTFAKDQPEYLPLPAWRDEEGQVVSCWKLTFVERLKVVFGTNIWLSQLTFNQPLQPQKPYIGSPFVAITEVDPSVPERAKSDAGTGVSTPEINA
jgi:hypothetical protein